MSNHTPGPWIMKKRHNDARYCNSIVHITAEKRHYADEIATLYQCESPDQDANARLIAASPDMLLALQMALDDSEVLNPDGSARPIGKYVLERMRAAIAKATGEA